MDNINILFMSVFFFYSAEICTNPKENKVTFTLIILLVKITDVFTCIMAVYNINDTVSTCRHRKAPLGACVQERAGGYTQTWSYRVSYFRSGKQWVCAGFCGINKGFDNSGCK